MIVRMALPLLLAAFAAGCGGLEYRDSNAAVDADPMCVSAPDQPDQPVSKACEREQAATWKSERRSQPVDFRGDDDDR